MNLERANSCDLGVTYEQGEALNDAAEIEIYTVVDKKLVKDGKTYIMPVYISYLLSYLKDADGI